MVDFEPERWARSPFVIGLLGALVALRSAPGESWGGRLFNLVAGALLAGYWSPAIAEFFALTTPATQGAMSFAVGLFGMNFVAAAVVWIKQLQLADVIPWIKARPPKE